MLIDYNEASSRATEGGVPEVILDLSASKIYKTRPDCIESIQTCYENQATTNRETKYTYQSTGQTAELSARYSFVPPDLVLVITEDIGQRKHDEEALRMSEERFRLLIENQGEGAGIVDLNEVFQFANPAAHRILGTDWRTRRTKSQRVCFARGLAGDSFDHTRKRLEGLSTTYELNIVRPDGIHRCLLVTGTPQSDASGEVSERLASSAT